MIKKIKEVSQGTKIRPLWFTDDQAFAEIKHLDIENGNVLCIVDVPDLGVVPVTFHEDDEVEVNDAIPAKEGDSIIGGGGDGFEDKDK